LKFTNSTFMTNEIESIGSIMGFHIPTLTASIQYMSDRHTKFNRL